MKKKSLLLIMIVAILFTSITVNAVETCDGVFGDGSEGSLLHIFTSIFDMIKIAVPIILVAATTIEFGMVVFSDSKDGMEKAKKNFGRRALMAVIIFFIPIILEIILNYANDESIKSCLNNF